MQKSGRQIKARRFALYINKWKQVPDYNKKRNDSDKEKKKKERK